MLRRLLALALGAGLCLSCRQPATQLVVLVDTDYVVPGELSDLRVVVSDLGGDRSSELDFVLNGRGENEPPRYAVPLSFGVVPFEGDAGRRVQIMVTGRAPGAGTSLVTRRARTGFLEGQSLLLPMFLLRSCEGVICGDGETCDDGVCVPDEVDPLTLRPIAPGDERDGGLGVDAGSDGMDAGSDAAVDAGTDAGPDTGTDAGGGPRFVRTLASELVCAGTSTDVVLGAPVPAGDTLVVGLIWRNAGTSASSVSDPAANTWTLAERFPSGNPNGAVYVSRLDTGLEAGAALSITHPETEVVSVVVDQLAGVSPAPAASASQILRSRDVAVEMTSPSAGLMYALLGNHNNEAITVTGGWTRAADHIADCSVAFGAVDHRTFHQLGGPGRYALGGTYAMPQSWAAMVLAFEPAP